ncbi:phosphohydrolase [Pseudomonas kuykendallii]|uniref:Oligoribonuclease NrnB or cAMP/cGMP phosphodiesterase, DHH superfamily n=1 Tax=Pseudomonas kuykendallii TaxID=1007099 RepID=A0A1H3EN42_9PSED|nr:phosphohydrolase [Pseudomonas kuykendallii]MCQ4271052.1 phosphohydrolase [Pseudomonas kuykendallii]SDX79369.1 Oligoribonuclease NrnB or cAMP/cGMP phosphodiesterase, DHH superfamily [Pseudomonas kuykendallii]
MAEQERVICIYHGGCADGFGAAYAVWRALGRDVEFHPAKYGSAPPDVAGAVVLVVDFSYPLETLQAMADVAEQVLVIDHHKTAAEALAALPEAPMGYHAWRQRELRLSAIFDIRRSGAGLTWDFLNPGWGRPALVDYIEDRDLWRFSLSATREVMAGLFSYPQEFEVWAHFMEGGVRQLLQDGKAIERKQRQDVAAVIRSSLRRMMIGDHDVPVVNAPYTMASDVGHVLLEGEPFAATYYDAAEERVFSLRSSDNGVDVGAISEQYGGGGHRNASGFRVPHGHVLAGGVSHG